jgi:hypothetical protein
MGIASWVFLPLVGVTFGVLMVLRENVVGFHWTLTVGVIFDVSSLVGVIVGPNLVKAINEIQNPNGSDLSNHVRPTSKPREDALVIEF